MDPARRWSDRFSNILEKGDDVVICPLLDLRDLRNGEPRALPNFRCVPLRNLAKLSHCFAGEHFNLKPNFKLAFVRPDPAHLWPGVTIDHFRKIKASAEREKRFVYKKIAPDKLAERFQNSTVDLSRSTNAGTHETPVVLYTHLTGRKKARHCCPVSLVLFVHELTARTRSPSESLDRGLRTWWFFFMLNPFL